MITYNDLQQLNTVGQQVANSVGAIFTTASNKHTLVKTIVLHNTNTTTENIALYIGGTTDPYKVAYIGLEANETYELTPGVPFVLYTNASTSALNAVTTTASKVNIVLIGMSEV
jgi:hypothetical protein